MKKHCPEEPPKYRRVAIVGKGATCTNILGEELKKFDEIFFLNEAYFLAAFIDHESCHMFSIDVEPVVRVTNKGLRTKVYLPEFPHAGERPSTLWWHEYARALGIYVEPYKLTISGEPLPDTVVAINSSLQACLSFAGCKGARIVDLYGFGGKTHQHLQFPKSVPRETYDDQFDLVEKIATMFGLKLNWL